MNEIILRAEGIEVCYGDRTVLGPVDLELKRGERLAVLGANGAGKSTLLKALFGEVPLRHGSVTINGSHVGFRSASKLSGRGCFYAPFGMDVYPDLTVEDNLLLFANAVTHEQGTSRARTGDRLSAILKLLPQLTARLDVCAGRLSGGERRLLSIARAHLQSPSLLLWDEPFSGISSARLPEVQNLVMPTRDGGAMIMAEQNIALALATCTHALVLFQGRVVFHGLVECLPENSVQLFGLIHGTTRGSLLGLEGRFEC